MTDLRFAEHDKAQSVKLADVAGRALASSDVVKAVPDPEGEGRWKLTPITLVGVATVAVPDGSRITVRIAPKLPIQRLLFMVGHSLHRRGWRSEDVELDEEEGFVPAFTRMFVVQAEKALRQGLLKGYVQVEETSPVLRGRTRHSDQVKRHHGRAVPAEVAHDDYTADITENRLLRAAVESLLRMPEPLPANVRSRLLRLKSRLVDVSPLPAGGSRWVWSANRLNGRYHAALRLADLVLRGDSVEHRPGEVTVNGFLFNLATIFEDFVTGALRESLAGRARCELQDEQYLDERGAIRMKPDLVAYDENGVALAVVDAKYKVEKPSGFPDADLYQMLAYCTALNLTEGHLVYAKGNASHGFHRVKHAGITLHQHALDLDQPPAGVLDDIQLLANRLVAAQSM